MFYLFFEGKFIFKEFCFAKIRRNFARISKLLSFSRILIQPFRKLSDIRQNFRFEKKTSEKLAYWSHGHSHGHTVVMSAVLVMTHEHSLGHDS